MKSISARCALLVVLLATASHALADFPMTGGIIPDSCGLWQAVAPSITYDPKTIFDYLDGGAEIYLAYGMKEAMARRFESPGRPAIEASVFTMQAPEGAFGVFTYERLDEDAGVGQGSEYGAGILRFWQGRSFVFLQAESETPEVRATVIALGRSIAARLGPPAPPPPLVSVLPQSTLRLLAVRFTLTPTVLQNLEPTLAGNPTVLPHHAPAILGRYGAARDRSRIIVIALQDSASAERSADLYRTEVLGATNGTGASPAVDPARSCASAVGNYVVLILDMPGAESAHRHLNEVTHSLRRIRE
jgi:hypothetical protein